MNELNQKYFKKIVFLQILTNNEYSSSISLQYRINKCVLIVSETFFRKFPGTFDTLDRNVFVIRRQNMIADIEFTPSDCVK